MHFYSNKFKLITYFAIISLGISINTVVSISNNNLHTSSEIYIQIISGMISGPFVTLLFLKQKGIYSTSVLIVFLSELSLICTGLYNNSQLAMFLGNLALGITITSSMILCPLITHYLRGPIPFVKVFPYVLIAYFAGLISINPLIHLPHNVITSTNFILLSLALLLCGFFTVFSAWKHRLVLLK